MAKFYAISEADTVGTINPLPFPAVAFPLTGSTNAFFYGSPPLSDYYVLNVTPSFSPTADIASFAHIKSSGPFVPGAGEVQQVWKADSGDHYAQGSIGTPSDDTFLGLAATASPSDATKANGTEQQLNQFFFKFDDKLHGSDFNDKLCGWEGMDKEWGGEGADWFYYGKGMGKDSIMDYNKKEGDQLHIDDSVATKYKQLYKMVKYNTNKDFTKIKAGNGDNLKVYGIDTQKELHHAVHFDDFTDFA